MQVFQLGPTKRDTLIIRTTNGTIPDPKRIVNTPRSAWTVKRVK